MKRFIASAGILVFLAGCGAAPTAGIATQSSQPSSFAAQRSLKPAISASEKKEAMALLKKTFEFHTPDHWVTVKDATFEATAAVGVFNFEVTLKRSGFGGAMPDSTVEGVINLNTGAVSRPREGSNPSVPTQDVLRPQDIEKGTALVKKALEVRMMDNSHTLKHVDFNRTPVPGVIQFHADMVNYDFAGRKHEYQVDGVVNLNTGKVTKNEN